MRKVLSQKFFDRDTREVARDLLGKFLVRKIGDKEIAVMINEVEMYDGEEDKASHARHGKTERNKLMWGKAGYFYVYFVYGMHYLVNVVVGKIGHPSAVLIRGAETTTQKVTGPARLTKFLKIDKKMNGKLATKSSELWFEDRGVLVDENKIQAAPRIGIAYAGDIWSKKQYRFILV